MQTCFHSSGFPGYGKLSILLKRAVNLWQTQSCWSELDQTTTLPSQLQRNSTIKTF